MFKSESNSFLNGESLTLVSEFRQKPSQKSQLKSVKPQIINTFKNFRKIFGIKSLKS